MSHVLHSKLFPTKSWQAINCTADRKRAKQQTWSKGQTANLNGFVGGEHHVQAFECFLSQVRPCIKHKLRWKVLNIMPKLIIDLSTCPVFCHTVDRCHYCLLNDLQQKHSHVSIHVSNCLRKCNRTTQKWKTYLFLCSKMCQNSTEIM